MFLRTLCIYLHIHLYKKIRQMLSEEQILLKKQYGDMNLVAQMLTKKMVKYISPMNAGKLIERKNAKNHQVAIDCLRKVVENREKLLETEIIQS